MTAREVWRFGPRAACVLASRGGVIGGKEKSGTNGREAGWGGQGARWCVVACRRPVDAVAAAAALTCIPSGRLRSWAALGAPSPRSPSSRHEGVQQGRLTRSVSARRQLGLTRSTLRQRVFRNPDLNPQVAMIECGSIRLQLLGHSHPVLRHSGNLDLPDPFWGSTRESWGPETGLHNADVPAADGARPAPGA
jgi:hypothetical protein